MNHPKEVLNGLGSCGAEMSSIMKNDHDGSGPWR